MTLISDALASMLLVLNCGSSVVPAWRNEISNGVRGTYVYSTLHASRMFLYILHALHLPTYKFDKTIGTVTCVHVCACVGACMEWHMCVYVHVCVFVHYSYNGMLIVSHLYGYGLHTSTGNGLSV